MEIYEKTVRVLGPEVSKAKDLMRFVQIASNRFCEEVRVLSHPEKRKDFISETYLLTLAKLINMFATLDALKNMKACINNDLSCHRRSVRERHQSGRDETEGWGGGGGGGRREEWVGCCDGEEVGEGDGGRVGGWLWGEEVSG